MKGFLAFHDQAIERRDDIEVLVTLAVRFEPEFSAWLEAAVRLTPYATEFRYPSGFLEPLREEFEEALRAASGSRHERHHSCPPLPYLQPQPSIVRPHWMPGNGQLRRLPRSARECTRPAR